MSTQKSFKTVFFDSASNEFVVEFSYNAQTVSAIKEAIPFNHRKYDPLKKRWTVKKTGLGQLMQFVSDQNFNVADSAKRHFGIQAKSVTIEQAPGMPQLKIEIPLKKEPYPYQKEGIAYNLQHRNVLIGDTQGLGKTVQAIGSVVGVQGFPCLIVCPAHLKINWREEWEMWTNYRAIIMDESVKKHASQYLDTGFAKIVIVNYESLPKYFAAEMIRSDKTNKVTRVRLNGMERYFKSIIIDEVHESSNTKTQRYKILKAISSQETMLMRLALSGTPVKNKVTELLNILNLINTLDIFGGWKGFMDKYAGMEKTRFGMKENPQNLDELQVKLKSNCYYRREKHEVLQQLPDKFRTVLKVEISNRAEYHDAQTNFENYLREAKRLTPGEIENSLRAEILVQMMHLQQISARGKITAARDFIRTVVDQGQKIVIFCHHKEVVEALHKEFPTFGLIVGGLGPEKKDKAVKDFQNNPDVMGVICSMKAASTGLTLTASNTVLFIELPWTSERTEQCEDRTHRIGQKNAVNAYYILGDKTIDEKMYKAIEYKRQLARSVTGANDNVTTEIKNEADLFGSILRELM